MNTVSDSSSFSPAKNVYQDASMALGNSRTSANLEDFNAAVGQLVKSIGADNPEEVLPSLIDLLVLMKEQVASLMLESKELRSLLVEAKADIAIEKSLEELEKIESSNRGSDIMSKLQSILQPLLLAVSAVAVFVAPTPLTVGLLIFSVGMYIDEQVASATGNDSLLTTMVSKLESGLTEILPPKVAQVLAPVIVVFSMIALSVLVAKGGLAVASKYGSRIPGVSQLQGFVATKLGNILADPQKAQQVAHKITNYAIVAGEAAQQAIIVANSTFQYQTAQLQHSIDILDADIATLQQMSDMLEKVLGGFMSDYQQSKSWSVVK